MPRSLKLTLFALVLVGLIGGSVAYYVAQKSLTLSLDGESRTVRTYADTVAEVLEDEGLRPKAHDVVLPAPDSTVADGDTVVVNRARTLQLTVDGRPSEVYTTALSVDDALDQLGFRADGLVVSASRSERLPLDGMALSINTPKAITLMADGQERVVTTTAGTAADLLAEQHITLSPTDTTSLYGTQPLLDRMRLQVFRVRVDQVVEQTAIPFTTIQTQNPDAFEGDDDVTQAGKAGQQRTTWQVTTVDGVETGRSQVSTAVLTAPVDELITVGTKEKPSHSPSADGLNWAALAACESGGRPDAVSSSGKYRGMYQFAQSTWNAVGGSGDPAAASADEQTYRAQLLYERSGAGQWGCGSHLYD